MRSHLDGQAVFICEGCWKEIEELPAPDSQEAFVRNVGQGNYVAEDGDGNHVRGHVHLDAEGKCAEKFKANAKRVKHATPEEVPVAA